MVSSAVNWRQTDHPVCAFNYLLRPVGLAFAPLIGAANPPCPRRGMRCPSIPVCSLTLSVVPVLLLKTISLSAARAARIQQVSTEISRVPYISRRAARPLVFVHRSKNKEVFSDTIYAKRERARLHGVCQ